MGNSSLIAQEGHEVGRGDVARPFGAGVCVWPCVFLSQASGLRTAVRQTGKKEHRRQWYLVLYLFQVTLLVHEVFYVSQRKGWSAQS